MDGYMKARHQAAGHDGAFTDPSETLFIKPSTPQEIEFYTKVQAMEMETECTNNEEEEEEEEYEMGSRLIDWIPVFLGTLERGISSKVHESTELTDEMRDIDAKMKRSQITDEQPFLVLQNLLYGFYEPSILDIKLGKVLHDDNTSLEKRQRLSKVSESTTSGSLHYRICGMKLYHDELPSFANFKSADIAKNVTKDDDGYIHFNKWYGRGLNADEMISHFKIFFFHNKLSSAQQQIMLKNFYTRLQLLYNCLLAHEVEIRSGSLLFVYENNLSRWKERNNEDTVLPDGFTGQNEDENEDEDEDTDEKTKAPLSSLSLIDFAHTKFTPGKGHDENIIVGIENLLSVLEQLIID